MNNLTPLFYRMTKILLYGKTGNRYAEIQLIKNNWNVTAVDLDKNSYEIMKKKTNIKKLELTKKYDYIIAINSIPYMDKKYLEDLMSNIIKHSNKNCIITITFFTKKNYICYKKNMFWYVNNNYKKII